MSILSVLFVLMFLLLLVLDSLSLPWIVMLVINHTPMVHVVLFLIVGINLCVTKLRLFPTIQKPFRHLVMAGFSDAMKSEKFAGVNFKRW
jgi:hypothetical protein